MSNAFPLPFPYLPGDQTPDSFEDRVQQNMQALALALGERPQALGVLQLAVGGTQRKVAFGTGTLTWPAANSVSNTLTVTHGLGTTPLVVVVTLNSQPAAFTYPAAVAKTLTATTFQVDARTSDGSTPPGASTAGFYWVAIG